MNRKMRSVIKNIVWKDKNTIPLKIALDLFVKTGYLRFIMKLVNAGPIKTAAADKGRKHMLAIIKIKS